MPARQATHNGPQQLSDIRKASSELMSPVSPQSAAHGTSSTSLKRRLLTPFLVCIVLLTVVVAVLVHQAGQRVIGDSMDTVLTQKVANITHAIQRHLLGSVAALEVAAPLGLTFSPDISQQLPALQERFWTATSLHSRPYDYVYFGNEAGQSFGMKRLESDLAEMRVSLSPQEPRRLFHISKIDGKPVYEGSDTRPFDPRTRPWYVTGSTTSVPVWTPVYVDFSRRDLVMTRSRRVLDENNRLIGVIAASLEASSQRCSGADQFAGVPGRLDAQRHPPTPHHRNAATQQWRHPCRNTQGARW